jgi:PAS domain S-box-containing protein
VAARFLEARLLASIVESSDDAIVRKSLDSVIQSWNAGAERIFGYTAEEAVGRHISIVIPPDRLAEEDRIIATLKEGRRVEPFETERVRKDGRRIRVSVTISPIKDEAGNVVAASKIARDVTKQRQAEAEREMFATLIENSTDFIAIADLDAVPIFVNRAGLSWSASTTWTRRARCTSGTSSFPRTRPGSWTSSSRPSPRKGHGEVDVRFRNFKTGDGRWMAYKVLKLTDDKGQALGFATVSQDITERRRLEDGLRQLAANLSEEGRRKNEFLATLAHELRNPLAALSNMLEILRRSGPGQAAPPPQAVDGMGRQLSQLVRLVDDLLDLSRITHNRLELRKGPVELGAVIDQAVESLATARRVDAPRAPRHPLPGADRPRRRRRPARPGLRESPQQQREVHEPGRQDRGEDRAPRQGGRGDGEGQRRRDPARPAGQHLRDVQPGPRLPGTEPGRPRHRLDAGPPSRADARRLGPGRERRRREGGRVRGPPAHPRAAPRGLSRAGAGP